MGRATRALAAYAFKSRIQKKKNPSQISNPSQTHPKSSQISIIPISDRQRMMGDPVEIYWGDRLLNGLPSPSPMATRPRAEPARGKRKWDTPGLRLHGLYWVDGATERARRAPEPLPVIQEYPEVRLGFVPNWLTLCGSSVSLALFVSRLKMILDSTLVLLHSRCLTSVRF